MSGKKVEEVPGPSESSPPESNDSSQPQGKQVDSEQLVKNVNVLIQSVMKGQRAGAYTLEDAAIIQESVKYFSDTFNPKQE